MYVSLLISCSFNTYDLQITVAFQALYASLLSKFVPDKDGHPDDFFMCLYAYILLLILSLILDWIRIATKIAIPDEYYLLVTIFVMLQNMLAWFALGVYIFNPTNSGVYYWLSVWACMIAFLVRIGVEESCKHISTTGGESSERTVNKNRVEYAVPGTRKVNKLVK